MQAVIKKYEVGINVFTSENPDLYLQELKQVNIGAKVLPIKEDIHYKEYKQFSTQRDKDKRIIYIFYNKTFEARSKRKVTERESVPENILRVEKDNKRPFEKILFSGLLNIDFQKLTINEFKQRFCNDLVYRETPIKPRNMKQADFDLCKNILENGLQATQEQCRNNYKRGRLSERTYYRHLQKIELLSKHTPEIELKIDKRAIELNNLIINKISNCQKWQYFEQQR
jgi:hypothetical protein